MDIEWTQARAWPPLVVLDMDGVLLHLGLDTERVRAEVTRAFAGAGIERELRPLVASMEAACAELASRDPELGAAIRAQVWDIVDQEELRAAERCQAAAGALELMDALAGCETGLFTNNGRAAALRALGRAGIGENRFLDMQARNGPGSIKPSAEPVIALVEASARAAGGVPPKRVFVVGDHPSDMQSAVLAQERLAERGWNGTVVPIAVRRPGRPDAEMEDAGAWFIAADLAEVAQLVTTRPVPASLSLVLLAYDEEESIARAVLDARRFCRLYAAGYQIVVVDDGSRDGTAAAAERASEGDVTLVRHAINQGMGAAMRDGYLASTQEYIAHLPADRQVRPQALAAFLPHVQPDVVVLSRYKTPPSGQQRAWLSKAFRALTRVIGGLTVDFAGTYVFHRSWLETVNVRALVSDTFLLSFELLQAIERRGCGFVQVEIHNFPREVGTSREARLMRMARVLREMMRYRAHSTWRQVAPDWLQRDRGR